MNDLLFPHRIGRVTLSPQRLIWRGCRRLIEVLRRSQEEHSHGAFTGCAEKAAARLLRCKRVPDHGQLVDNLILHSENGLLFVPIHPLMRHDSGDVEITVYLSREDQVVFFERVYRGEHPWCWHTGN